MEKTNLQQYNKNFSYFIDYNQHNTFEKTST